MEEIRAFKSCRPVLEFIDMEWGAVNPSIDIRKFDVPEELETFGPEVSAFMFRVRNVKKTFAVTYQNKKMKLWVCDNEQDAEELLKKFLDKVLKEESITD